MIEPVDHEFQTQEQGQGGQDERGGPKVPTEAPIEQARGDKTAGEARVFQPINAVQPRPFAGPAGLGWVDQRMRSTGAHQNGAGAGPGAAVQVHAFGHLGTERGEEGA